MELKRFAAIFLRWKWLILISILLAAVSAFVTSSLITPTFEASTTLLISKGPDTQVSDYEAILTSERLARTYVQLFAGRPVLEETLTRLDLAMEFERLEEIVEVKQIRDTQLIELKVEHEQPGLASDLANTLAEVFVEQNEALQAGRFAASKESLRGQLDKLGAQIQVSEAAIANLGIPRTSNRIAELERLQVELAQYEASYTNLLQSYEELRTTETLTISNVIQVEPAVTPKEPIRPRVLLNTVLAGVVGGMIALGVVFLIEYLNDTIRTTEDVERVFQVPILGTIAEAKELNRKDQGPALLAEEQDPALVAAFRSLRTNLEFLGGPRFILVASPGPDEGKTTVASHLAATIGNGANRVVLIDADLRRPGLHEVFGVPNELGLSDILMDNLEPQGVAHSFDNSHFKLITSGRRVDDPSELFGSDRLLEVLAQLREQSDIVIFDGPPFLATEALVLASRLKSVLLVIQPGQTHEDVATMIMKQFGRTKANLLGVVLNRIPKSQAYASAGYFDYDDDDDERNLKEAEHERNQSSPDPEDTQTSPIDGNQRQPSRGEA